jgi:hypothetical protein
MLSTLNPRNCGVASTHSIRKFFLGQLKLGTILNHQTCNPLKLGNPMLLPLISSTSLSSTPPSHISRGPDRTDSLSWHGITLPEMVSELK